MIVSKTAHIADATLRQADDASYAIGFLIQHRLTLLQSGTVNITRQNLVYTCDFTHVIVHMAHRLQTK